MRKLAMIVAALAAFCAPASAQQTPGQTFSGNDIKIIAVTMMAYDAKCGGLGPNGKELMHVLLSTLDNRAEAAAAAVSMNAGIEAEGVARWCARLRPTAVQFR